MCLLSVCGMVGGMFMTLLMHYFHGLFFFSFPTVCILIGVEGGLSIVDGIRFEGYRQYATVDTSS